MKLLKFLFEPNTSLFRYCAAAVPMAMIPSAILVGLAWIAAELLGIDMRSVPKPVLEPTLTELAGAVFIGPLVETAILAIVVYVLSRWINTAMLVATCSALIWGGLHAMAAPFWFFGTVWSFFVFSAAFIAWERKSFSQGFIAASVPHAAINLLVMAVLFMGK
ncbi:MAG: hypothetical protein SF172_11210 [Burkholderiales bacterium]|nr:hypothetical protein [Burkholderiales bacterium]